MNSRRSFLLSLPILAAGVSSAQEEVHYPLGLNGVDTAKTVEDLKKSLVLAQEWREATYDKKKFMFAITDQGDGESYIDLHGWVYSQFFKEWRRILLIKTRRVGNAKLVVDEQKGVLSLQGTGVGDFKDVDVFRFDLRATGDDAEYVH